MIKFWWRSGSPGKTCLGGSMHCRSASSYVSKTCLAMHYSKVSTFWHQTQRISLPPQSVPHASCCLLDPFCSAYTHPTPAWLVEYLAMLVRTHTMSLTGNVICKKQSHIIHNSISLFTVHVQFTIAKKSLFTLPNLWNLHILQELSIKRMQLQLYMYSDFKFDNPGSQFQAFLQFYKCWAFENRFVVILQNMCLHKCHKLISSWVSQIPCIVCSLQINQVVKHSLWGWTVDSDCISSNNTLKRAIFMTDYYKTWWILLKRSRSCVFIDSLHSHYRQILTWL